MEQTEQRTQQIAVKLSQDEHAEIMGHCQKTGQKASSLGRKLFLEEVRGNAK